MESGCFALEYARGWIPPMLGFGYADSKFLLPGENERWANDKAAFSSTLDFPTLWRTTYVTGREMIGNLMKGKL
jgi:C-8 sterol isomerase